MLAAAQPPYWGVLLSEGSSGPDVALMQRWLNGLRETRPALPLLTVDGRFGRGTARAVTLFQAISGLKADGVVGPDTWQAISGVYQARHGAGEIYPGVALRTGSRGAAVKSAQQKLKATVPSLTADGVFGEKTKSAVTAYQTVHGLTADGVIGPATWQSLFGVR